MPPTYNPFIKNDQANSAVMDQLSDYQQRYDMQGIPTRDDPSVTRRMVDMLRRAAGYGLQGLDIVMRPYNSLASGLREGLHPDSTPAQGVLDAMNKGIHGDIRSSLGDIVGDYIPAARVPYKEYPEMLRHAFVEGWDTATPEEISRHLKYQTPQYRENYGEPSEPGLMSALGHMLSNTSAADMAGLFLDTKGINAITPKLSPVVRSFKGAEKGSGSTYTFTGIPAKEQQLKDVFEQIGPEVAAARSAPPTQSISEILSGTPRAPREAIPRWTSQVESEIPAQVTEAEHRLGGFLRDVDGVGGIQVDPSELVPTPLRKALLDMDAKNIGVSQYKLSEANTAVKVRGLKNDEMQRLTSNGYRVAQAPDGTVVVSFNVADMTPEQIATKWEDASALLRSRDTRPVTGTTKTAKAFREKYGQFTSPQTVTEEQLLGPKLAPPSASPGRTYRMAAKDVVPDERNLYETAQDIAAGHGINLDWLIDESSRAPVVGDLRNMAERARMGRVAAPEMYPGLGDVKLGRGNVNIVDKAERTGSELKLGNLVLADQGKVASVLNPIKKTIYEDTPIVSPLIQTMGPMLSRGFVKKGAPKEIAQVPKILDSTQAASRAEIQNLAKEVGPILQGLDDNELRLITYARDIDKNFDFSDTAMVQELARRADIDVPAAQLAFNAQSYQLALNKAGDVLDKFATTEQQLGILDEIQQNYVPHVYEMNQQFKELYGAKDVAARAFARTHKFSKRTGPETLIQARDANKEALAQGLPEPYKIKEDRIDKLIGIRAGAHYRTSANVLALNDIKGLGSKIIDQRYHEGFVQPAIPQLKGYWVHPELNRIMVEATGQYTATGPAFQKFLTGIQKLHTPWKTIVTRLVPAFHIRNELDNLLKLYLDKTDMSLTKVAYDIMRGVEGTLETKSGPITYQELRRMAETKGLRGTGQYGQFGDIPSDIADVAMRTAEGPLRHFVRYLNPLELGQRVGDSLETHAKVTKFLDEMVKYGDPDYAANQANRLMFNYADITPVERDVLRTLYPFWTFQRKNVPLMYELATSNPEQFLKLQMVKQTLERKFDQGEDESYAPEYLKQMWNVKLPGQGSRKGTEQYLTPGFSVDSLQTPFEIPVQAISALAPMFKMAVEYATDKSSLTQDPIQGPGEEKTVEIPNVFDQLPDALKSELHIHWGRNPDTGQDMLMAPAIIGHMLDTLTGSSIRNIGNMFKSQSPESDQRNPIQKALVKEVDPEQVKYFNAKDELERMRARTSRLGREGTTVYTANEMGMDRYNPFLKPRVPR